MSISSANHYWVAKFGGTSVANYEAMARCASLIMDYPKIRVVVVSAPAGITNLLIELHHAINNGINPTSILKQIQDKIQAILIALPPTLLPDLQQEVVNLLHNIENLAQINDTENLALLDELLSHGERISARLFTCVLSHHGFAAAYLDARTLIKTNGAYGKAEVLIPETKSCVQKSLLAKCVDQIVVTEGFIGRCLQETTTTLGRGGSDYSAALLAEAIEAEVLQIWTDVSGIYTVDPRLVSKAKPIDNMCFTEAAELANFGAKVLHPTTLWPAIRKNIPVYVGSSLNPKINGTWIKASDPVDVEKSRLHAIALRRNQSLLTIHSLEMLHAHGFLAKVFTTLANHELSIDLVTTSEVSVALTFNNPDANNQLLTEKVLSELQAIGNVSLHVDQDLCLIALVGNNLHRTPGISGRVFHVLRPFNVRLICHGASPHNLCFLVNEQDAESAVQAMHAEFFENN